MFDLFDKIHSNSTHFFAIMIDNQPNHLKQANLHSELPKI